MTPGRTHSLHTFYWTDSRPNQRICLSVTSLQIGIAYDFVHASKMRLRMNNKSMCKGEQQTSPNEQMQSEKGEPTDNQGLTKWCRQMKPRMKNSRLEDEITWINQFFTSKWGDKQALSLIWNYTTSAFVWVNLDSTRESRFWSENFTTEFVGRNREKSKYSVAPPACHWVVLLENIVLSTHTSWAGLSDCNCVHF